MPPKSKKRKASIVDLTNDSDVENKPPSRKAAKQSGSSAHVSPPASSQPLQSSQGRYVFELRSYGQLCCPSWDCPNAINILIEHYEQRTALNHSNIVVERTRVQAAAKTHPSLNRISLVPIHKVKENRGLLLSRRTLKQRSAEALI